jgi:arsenite methyltransferase
MERPPANALTVRAFKLDSLEDICEDYGQVAIYKGSLPGSPRRFVLDDHHIFITGKPMLVCGNTAVMLQETHYSDYFEIIGDRSTHYGPFDCKPSATLLEGQETNIGGSCC